MPYKLPMLRDIGAALYTLPHYMFKDLLIPLSAITPITLATLSHEELTFWERVAEKWGIGFIGLGLFCALAWFTHKREIRLQAARDIREAEDKQERVALATRNNELQQEQLDLLHSHAKRLEYLVKEGNHSRDQHAAAMRMIVRKLKHKGIVKIDEEDLDLEPRNTDHDERIA